MLTVISYVDHYFVVCGLIFIVIGQYIVNIPEIFQAQLVQKVDSAINRINHCVADKY